MAYIKTILLAEDDPRDVELILEALDDNNLVNKVVVVYDGVEAMEYLQQKGKYATRKAGHPVLILLDINMPRMNGLEVLQNIRADESLKKIPVIMLTCSREENDLTQSYDLGVNAYVVKPLESQPFINAIKQIGGFWAILNEQPN
jgi:two-component system, response regulator